MTRKYKKPADFRQALKVRIRRRARELDQPYNRVLQTMILERFTARVYDACAADVLLKGGLVMELRLRRPRTTKDVDIRLMGNLDEHVAAIRERAALEGDDFLRFLVADEAPLNEVVGDQIIYEGRRVNIQPILGGKNFGGRFHLDISMADKLVLPHETKTGTDLLSFAGIPPIEHRIYPKEAHIAEKLHAWSLPRNTDNGRAKDLVDIGLFATTETFEFNPLRRSIEATFNARDTHPVPTQIPSCPDGWDIQYNKMRDEDELDWTDLSELKSLVARFLNPVLGGQEVDMWNPESQRW